MKTIIIIIALLIIGFVVWDPLMFRRAGWSTEKALFLVAQKGSLDMLAESKKSVQENIAALSSMQPSQSTSRTMRKLQFMLTDAEQRQACAQAAMDIKTLQVCMDTTAAEAAIKTLQ